VMSAANIGRKVVIPAILAAENAELVALASSSEAGAALLADPGVDAVYIPLPNHRASPATAWDPSSGARGGRPARTARSPSP